MSVIILPLELNGSNRSIFYTCIYKYLFNERLKRIMSTWVDVLQVVLEENMMLG